MLNLNKIHIQQCMKCNEIKKADEFETVITDEYFIRESDYLSFGFSTSISEKLSKKSKKQLVREYKDKNLWKIAQNTAQLCTDCVDYLK